MSSVRLVFPDGTDRVVDRVRVRASGATYDRRLHRAPLGWNWFASGTRARSPEEFLFTVEVVEAGAGYLAGSRIAAKDLIVFFKRAARIVTPVATVNSAGVLSYAVTPIPLGYRLDITVGSSALSEPRQVVAGDRPVYAGDRPVIAGG